MKKAIIILSLLSHITFFTASAQHKIQETVEFDRLVHDFGEVLLTDGALSCQFTLKNISSKAIAIYQVSSSCGCTGVKWTRAPILPGKTGVISATYTNDEGPYPFDKSLTVYISGLKRPIILHLRGVANEKQRSPEEIYTSTIGAIGFRELNVKAPNLFQEEQRSGEIDCYNFSNSAATITFPQKDAGIQAKVIPNPLPPKSKGKIVYSITADRQHWGKNEYKIHPEINSRQFAQSLNFHTVIKEDFSRLSKEQIDKAPSPLFNSTSLSLGNIKAGTKTEAHFELTNIGKSDLLIYKADCDHPGASVQNIPAVQTKAKATLKVKIDTKDMKKGEELLIIMLTTNSPSRPIINLFVTMWIE